MLDGPQFAGPSTQSCGPCRTLTLRVRESTLVLLRLRSLAQRVLVLNPLGFALSLVLRARPRAILGGSQSDDLSRDVVQEGLSLVKD